MEITFLGTGTSMGVPVAGGFGFDEQKNDPRNQRYRTSAWVKTEESSILIDTSPEFRLQTIRAGIKQIDLVLITHEHMDHTAGLDDLRIYNYVQDDTIPLYTKKRTADAIKRRFDYMFGPDKYPGAVSVDINYITKPLQFRDCLITPLRVYHGKLEILGFRINDFTYITDVKALPEETMEQVKGSKKMVLGGLRWAPKHPTHLTIPEAAKIAGKLQIPETYLVHMNTYVEHGEVENKLLDEFKDTNVHLAYDQLSIRV